MARLKLGYRTRGLDAELENDELQLIFQSPSEEELDHAKFVQQEYIQRGIALMECPHCECFGETDPDCEYCTGTGMVPTISYEE